MKKYLINLLSSVVVYVLFTGQSWAFSISDAAMLDTDWLRDSVMVSGSNLPVLYNAQTPIGGNPGSFHEIVANVPGPEPSFETSAIYIGNAYDPGINGAISTIDMSIDRIIFDINSDLAASNPMGLKFGLIQDNVGFTPTDSLYFGNTTWETYGLTNLTENDFLSASSTNPDFSTNGSPIYFAYFSGAYYPGYFSDLSADYGFDNFSVDVSSVPVPPAAWLFGSGLLGLVGISRRGKPPSLRILPSTNTGAQ